MKKLQKPIKTKKSNVQYYSIEWILALGTASSGNYGGDAYGGAYNQMSQSTRNAVDGYQPGK
jgi:hypothetical protein